MSLGELLNVSELQLLLLKNGKNHRVSVRQPSRLLLPQDFCPRCNSLPPRLSPPLLTSFSIQVSAQRGSPQRGPSRHPAKTPSFPAPHPPLISLIVLSTPWHITELIVFLTNSLCLSVRETNRERKKENCKLHKRYFAHCHITAT